MRSAQLMTEAAVRSTPKALARQLASLTAEVQTYAARADAAAETPLTKELAAQLLTTVAACMINNVAPTIEESINVFLKTAESATSGGVADLAASVAALQQQVDEMKGLMATASFAAAAPKAADVLEKAIRDEAYDQVLRYVGVKRGNEG